MKKYLFAASMAALIGMGNIAQAATNVAAGLPSSSYTDDQSWNGYNAESLFNGGSWNAGNTGTHWVQVDLLSTRQITGVSYATDQSPNGYSWQNVYISDAPVGGNWSSLSPTVTFGGDTTTNTPISFEFGPIAGRYVTIVAANEISWHSSDTRYHQRRAGT